MSAHNSPSLAHLSHYVHPGTVHSTPTHMQGPPAFPTSAQSSFSDHKTESSSEGTPSKGKHGSGSDGKMKPHLCATCQRGFTTGGHLQRHQRIHTGIKAFKCPYPGCETRTSRQDNLQQHYRTHLSPTLRRGSGSAARAAVNAAMEAAGLKSSQRAPRKSKGSTGTNGTPSSASTSHVPSPYATPTSAGPTSYAPYMYDPQQQHAAYSQPHGAYMPQTASVSTNSSRVPSPANGHAAVPQPQYFPQQFPPMYYGGMHPQYRYNGGMPSYPGPHGMYSPGMAPEHMQYGGRDVPYAVPGGYPGQPQMNGYPSRTQTSTPSHDDAYRRPPSPRRRSPPHDFVSQGAMDPSMMSRPAPMPSYGGYQQPMGYNNYGAPPPGPPLQHRAEHRASISSASDGSGKGNE